MNSTGVYSTAVTELEQERSDGGVYRYQKKLCGYWLFFFLFDPGQIVVDFEIGMTQNLFPPPK